MIRSQLLLFDLTITIFLVSAINCFSQSDTSDIPLVKDFYKKELSKAQIDLLYSYYEQDGNHSPVLGGQGTEYLTDHVAKIIVNIPLGKNNFTLSGGIDHYTSASTDDIDPNSISSASVVDDRTYFDIAYSRQISKKHTFGINLGYSSEWDVISQSGGAFYAFTSANGNSQINISGQYYNDRWSLIYPIELRTRPEYPRGNDTRKVANTAVTFSQVINRRLQASISLEGIFQSGILHTPFHRVYFASEDYPKVENLPRKRIKIPVGLSANYYVSENIVLRSYYRYYTDDFDIRSHTLGIEAPVKIGLSWAISPFYRYYNQTASKYFAPYKEHSIESEFFTSDYDQSAFESHKLGFGLRYSPISGIFNTRLPIIKNQIQLKKIEFRTAMYNRSDGLKAYIFSIGFNFNLY